MQFLDASLPSVPSVKSTDGGITRIIHAIHSDPIFEEDETVNVDSMRTRVNRSSRSAANPQCEQSSIQQISQGTNNFYQTLDMFV